MDISMNFSVSADILIFLSVILDMTDWTSSLMSYMLVSWSKQIVFLGIQPQVILRQEVEKVKFWIKTFKSYHILADDARDFIPTDFIPSEVINPNLYMDYSVEIDIELLARNAICGSDDLKSIEKENTTAVDFT